MQLASLKWHCIRSADRSAFIENVNSPIDAVGRTSRFTDSVFSRREQQAPFEALSKVHCDLDALRRGGGRSTDVRSAKKGWSYRSIFAPIELLQWHADLVKDLLQDHRKAEAVARLATRGAGEVAIGRACGGGPKCQRRRVHVARARLRSCWGHSWRLECVERIPIVAPLHTLPCMYTPPKDVGEMSPRQRNAIVGLERPMPAMFASLRSMVAPVEKGVPILRHDRRLSHSALSGQTIERLAELSSGERQSAAKTRSHRTTTTVDRISRRCPCRDLFTTSPRDETQLGFVPSRLIFALGHFEQAQRERDD